MVEELCCWSRFKVAPRLEGYCAAVALTVGIPPLALCLLTMSLLFSLSSIMICIY